MTVHLITGLTGFVGGAIALELLATRPDARVVGVVRPLLGEPDPTARARAALRSMALGYGRPDLVDMVEQRVSAVAGDITRPGCGVDREDRHGADVFWHAAASLQYEERHREAIERHNVTGTRHALDLAGDSMVDQFNYVSTAYVAGARTGQIEEEAASQDAPTNNVYEATKVMAEHMVHESGVAPRVTVLRPGIVIGHSQTHHGVNYSGMYGFARQLLTFKHRSEAMLGTFLSHARLRLLAEPEITVNLVPVDMVARAAVAVSESSSSATFFHLVNSTPPTVGMGVCTLMDLLGFREPVWVQEKSGFTSLDERLNEGMGFYGSYLLNGKSFSTRNTEAVLGTGSCSFPIDTQTLTPYFEYYLRTQAAYEKVRAQPARVLHDTSEGEVQCSTR